MEYRVDVLAVKETRWATNNLTFPTQEAAEAYGRDLYNRWFLVERMSVVPVDTPKNLPYVEGERELLKL